MDHHSGVVEEDFPADSVDFPEAVVPVGPGKIELQYYKTRIKRREI